VKKRKVEYYLVRLVRPGGASYADIEDHIHLNVLSGCGTLSPENPMFHLDRSSVSVRRATKHRLIQTSDEEGF